MPLMGQPIPAGVSRSNRLLMSDPLLSICIPTYNRLGSVLPLVRRLLSSPSHEIEVVVSDNQSTDDTLGSLAKITDPRLVVTRNEINRGALFNQVNVLLLGRGTYSVLLLDKDSIDPAHIESFLDFLRKTSPLTGYCEYHQAPGTPALHFRQGFEALREMGYTCHHPSGYFFRKRELERIGIMTRFADHAKVGNFPFEFMQAELAMLGPAAVFREPLFVPESVAAARAIKSFTINGATDDVFYSPKGRLQMATRFALHILGLPLEDQPKRQLVFDQFLRGLRQSTLGFRDVMSNESICHHYHVKSRSVRIPEMLRIAIWFYRQFTAQLLDGRHGRLPISKGSLIVDTLGHFRRALGRKLGRHLE